MCMLAANKHTTYLYHSLPIMYHLHSKQSNLDTYTTGQTRINQTTGQTRINQTTGWTRINQTTGQTRINQTTGWTRVNQTRLLQVRHG